MGSDGPVDAGAGTELHGDVRRRQRQKGVSEAGQMVTKSNYLDGCVNARVVGTLAYEADRLDAP